MGREIYFMRPTKEGIPADPPYDVLTKIHNVLEQAGYALETQSESAYEFERVKAAGAEAKVPFFDMIKRYPREVLLGMGARYIDGVFFNIFAVFSVGYLANTIKMPRTDALWAVSAAAFVMIFSIPVFGKLSDRLGRPRTYAIGSFLLALTAVPLFWAFNTGNTGVVMAALIICFGIIYAMCYGPEAALFADLFDARVRYTGISFVYQFSGIFASGITPIIATALFEANGKQPWFIAGYVIFAALVSMACAMAIGRSARRDAPASA